MCAKRYCTVEVACAACQLNRCMSGEIGSQLERLVVCQSSGRTTYQERCSSCTHRCKADKHSLLCRGLSGERHNASTSVFKTITDFSKGVDIQRCASCASETGRLQRLRRAATWGASTVGAVMLAMHCYGLKVSLRDHSATMHTWTSLIPMPDQSGPLKQQVVRSRQDCAVKCQNQATHQYSCTGHALCPCRCSLPLQLTSWMFVKSLQCRLFCKLNLLCNLLLLHLNGVVPPCAEV